MDERCDHTEQYGQCRCGQWLIYCLSCGVVLDAYHDCVVGAVR